MQYIMQYSVSCNDDIIANANMNFFFYFVENSITYFYLTCRSGTFSSRNRPKEGGMM